MVSPPTPPIPSIPQDAPQVLAAFAYRALLILACLASVSFALWMRTPLAGVFLFSLLAFLYVLVAAVLTLLDHP